MTNKFPKYISGFFTDYLRKLRGMSEKTIQTYAYSLQSYIQYLKDNGISEKNISIECLNKQEVVKYLEWLENIKNNSIATRNLRLAVIHSFCEYLITENIEYFDRCTEILKIRFKKREKTELDYLKKEDIKLLLSKPDKSSKKGIRDLAIISTLYDSACRISEFVSIKKKDVNFSRNTISVMGKGRKHREIPISKKVMLLIKKYTEIYGINGNDYLFMNSRNEQLTRPGITFIINKYAKVCKEENKYFYQKKITPHVLRRSKATHLLEGNINIYYIRDFLGHESVQTTEIYVRTNVELKIEAINKHTEKLNIDVTTSVSSSSEDEAISLILNRFK